ncbi:MAG: protein-serine/threonine phosphatase, partial [Bacteroidota bacterium]
RLDQLTKDHSVVQNLVDQGVISADQAEQHPRRNEITKALGIMSNAGPEVAELPIAVKKGESILLCSDGLTGMVREARIERVLKKPSSAQAKVDQLIELANREGGHDNISVQLISFR